MKIRSKFIAVILASVILPVLIIATFSVMQFRTSVLDAFVESSGRELRQVDNSFTFFLNGLAEDASYLSSLEAVSRIDGSVTTYVDSPPGVMTPSQNTGIEAEIYQKLAKFGESYPDLAYVWLGTNHGGYIQWPEGNNTANYDPRIRPWYKAGMQAGGKVTLAAAYADASGEGRVLLDYLLKFESADGTEGVIGLDVTLTKLTELIRQIKLGASGYVMLVEDTGNVLADPAYPDHNFKQLNTLGDQYRNLAETQSGVVELEMNGERWFANAYISPELGWKFIGLVPAAEVFGQSNELAIDTAIIGVILTVLFLLFGIWLANVIARPINVITAGLQDIATGEGDLTSRLSVEIRDESGLMAGAFNSFVGVVQSLIGEIKQTTTEVDGVSDRALDVSNQIRAISEKQSLAIEQISTASNEMVSTANEVAENCAQTATAADSGLQYVALGRQYIQETAESVNQLEEIIHESNNAMSELAEESRNIMTILNTIRGIAEQTNLLALNAAIEAARAGEQGRGFAVVADEVRTLAKRTSDSTEEIDTLLSSLGQRTEAVVDKLGNSLKHSKQTVQTTEQTKSVFESIQESVSTIRDMTTQIASAAEEQHLVAEDINRNVTEVHDDAAKAREISEDAQRNSEQLEEQVAKLTALIARFKI